MKHLLQSKTAAWCALILIVLIIVFTFTLRTQWWMFFDEFFLFMAVFCRLASLYLMKFNPYVTKKLQSIAFLFLLLGIVAFIAEFIAFQILS